jgi:hypothetical protein
MGFISKNNKVILSAFLTQKGREFMINGSLEDFQVKYYSMSDPDVNYLVESNLTSGFIPDLSGNHEGGVRSLANGIEQKYTISGGDNVGVLGTDLKLGGLINKVGFTSKTIELTHNKNKNYIEVDVPVMVTGSITGNEQVKVYVLPPSQGTSSAIYTNVELENNGIMNWKDTVLLEKSLRVKINKNINTEAFKIILKVVAYKSSVDIPENNSVITLEGKFL